MIFQNKTTIKQNNKSINIKQITKQDEYSIKNNMSNTNKSNISNKVDCIMDDNVVVTSPSPLLFLWPWRCMIQ